jgi:hypothetical protein
MIREYILLSDGLSVANINFTLWSVKLRLMESDYRKLQQSQDNNSVMQNQMCIQALRAVLSVAQSHSKKSSRVHQQYCSK